MVILHADRPDELPDKIVAALDRLARGLRSHRLTTASRFGLTPLQAELLRTLAQGSPPEPVVGSLAVELGVSQPTVTDSLQALQRKGLLKRRRDRSDARRRLLSLTPAGRHHADALVAADQQLVVAVGALDRSQQETTIESLLTLIAGLVAGGVIQVARTCLTCQFHSAPTQGTHYCSLLEADLPPAELRVNCPEHATA